MEIRLHNTLTRRQEEFRPIDPRNVRMYVCGPTVYERAHIGNARPVVVFDTLYRLLRHAYGASHVTYVRNITDVEDKIIAAAAENGETIATLTERTTAYVGEMVAMIAILVDRGHAYLAEGHVLFDVPSMPDYGQLSKRSLDDMIAGARVEVA